MDIQYLLFLQDFRNAIGDALTPFMEMVSSFAVTYLLMLPVFIYWCFSKKNGLYVLASYYVTVAVNAVVKLTFCVYRPWIRDARVLPAGDSIKTATGYSFPSGHTATAAPIYGGIAVTAWDKKALRWLSVIGVICILITGFSRNYLGVHTPQDVFIAICEGVLALILMNRLFSYLEKNPAKEYIFLGIGFVAAWLGIIYITFKGYPMDYSADGKLIVDPQKMMNDGYGDLGKLMGFCAARFIDKKWIKFKPLELNAKSVVICLIGLIPMWAIINYVKAPVVELLGGHWGKLVYAVILVMYCLVVYPLVIKLIGRLTAKKAQ